MNFHFSCDGIRKGLQSLVDQYNTDLEFYNRYIKKNDHNKQIARVRFEALEIRRKAIESTLFYLSKAEEYHSYEVREYYNKGLHSEPSNTPFLNPFTKEELRDQSIRNAQDYWDY